MNYRQKLEQLAREGVMTHTFKTERAIIAALLEALADMTPKDGPLTCMRLLAGGDTDCDDAKARGIIGEECLACRVFTSLRIAERSLERLGLQHRVRDMSFKEQELIREAAALWTANALYVDGGGNYRWHRNTKQAGRIAARWNRTVKKHKADLHELGREFGFADQAFRDKFLSKRGLAAELS